jgi:hypothetical protein
VRLPTRRHSAWYAAACVALLIGAATLQATAGAPVAAAQDTRFSPFDCGIGGRGTHDRLPEEDAAVLRLRCAALEQECRAGPRSDPAEEWHCARLWCQDEVAPPGGYPANPGSWDRRPRYTENCGVLSRLGGDHERGSGHCPAPAEAPAEPPTDMPGPPPPASDPGHDPQAEQMPEFLSIYCAYLRARCDQAGELAPSHVDYCRAVFRAEQGIAPPDAAGSDDGSAFAGSRLCELDNIGGETSRNCEASGSAFRAYGLSSYGLDNWVNLGNLSLGGVISADDGPKAENFDDSALQSVAAFIWRAFVQIVDALLTLLEWAFTLDLIDGTFGELRDALLTIHEDVLGQPWTLAAIAVAGLWGIWNGLVRLRTIETLGSLGVTLLMMVAALVIIHDPLNTVWKYSALANDGAKAVLGGVASGNLSDPNEAIAGETRGIFDLLVHEPWCALQFGDVDYCNQEVTQEFIEDFVDETDFTEEDAETWTDEELETVELTWLSQVAGGEPRKNLYELTAEDDADRVRLMNESGTVDRLGLLAVIGIALIGALLLLLWLALKIVIAAIMVLILTLLTPVMLLVPAFGDGGRAAFVTWAKRLVAAILAKLIYALFLGVVMLVASMIVSLDLGWYPQWLILLVFWWGAFLKRGEIVGFLDAGEGSAWPRLATLYYGYRMGREALSAATWLPRKVGELAGGAGMLAGGVGRATRRAGRHQREGHSDALRERARAELGEHARTAHDAQRQSTDRTLAWGAGMKRRLGDVNRELGTAERQLAMDPEDRAPYRTDADLIARRDSLRGRARRLEARLNSGRMQRARSVAGREGGAADVDRWISGRRYEVDNLEADADQNLFAAGEDPGALRRARAARDDAEVERILHQSSERIRRDRDLVERLDTERTHMPARMRNRADLEWAQEVPREADRLHTVRPFTRRRSFQERAHSRQRRRV